MDTTTDSLFPFTIWDRNGRRFGSSTDQGRATRLAAKIGGTVTMILFGEVVTLTP